MPSPTADRGDAVRRYLAHARAHESSRVPAGPASRRRLVGTTLALWPMIPVSVLPVTFLLVAGLSVVLAPIDAGPLSVAVVAVLALLVAWVAARHLLSLPEPPARRPAWRRVLVVALALVYAWIGVAEIATGGRFADAVLLSWFVGLVWCWSFVGQARRRWAPHRVAMWSIGPVAVVVVFVLELSAGFFALRFDSARPELTDAARRMAAGEEVRGGVHVGTFEIGTERQVFGCDASFVITGWWRDDERWLAWCPAGRPQQVALDLHALGGDWYELDEG